MGLLVVLFQGGFFLGDFAFWDSLLLTLGEQGLPRASSESSLTMRIPAPPHGVGGQAWGSPPHYAPSSKDTTDGRLLPPVGPGFLLPLAPTHFLRSRGARPLSTHCALPPTSDELLPLVDRWVFSLPSSTEPALFLVLCRAVWQGGL